MSNTRIASDGQNVESGFAAAIANLEPYVTRYMASKEHPLTIANEAFDLGKELAAEPGSILIDAVWPRLADDAAALYLRVTQGGPAVAADADAVIKIETQKVAFLTMYYAFEAGVKDTIKAEIRRLAAPRFGRPREH